MHTNTKSFATAITVMALLVAGLLVLLWFQTKKIGDWPNEKETTSLLRKNAALRRSIAELEGKVRVHSLLEELVPILREEDAMARQVLPNKLPPQELVAAIMEKARQSGVTIRDVVPTPAPRRATGDGLFVPIPFRINLQGSYDQIASFINSMEEFERSGPEAEGLRRFFQVSELDIQATRYGLSLGEPHTARLSMTTYQYPGDD